MKIHEERKAFEEWFEDDAMPQESNWFKRDGEGYVNETVDEAWNGWQGRASYSSLGGARVGELRDEDFAGWNEVEVLRLKLGRIPTDVDWVPSPLGGLADVIAEYDKITAKADRANQEWDFVMRASDYWTLRVALLAPRIETRTYRDGTTATGIAPLPAHSPDEQSNVDEQPKRHEQDAFNALSRRYGEMFDLAHSFLDTLCRTLDTAERRTKASKPLEQDFIDAMTARLVADTKKLDGEGRAVPPHASGPASYTGEGEQPKGERP